MPDTIQRYQISIGGKVQGVGFRPFVYRLARSLGLTGWVRNGDRGVLIEAEGLVQSLAKFLDSLQQEQPIQAEIIDLTVQIVPCQNDTLFIIGHSQTSSQIKTAMLLTDLSICSDCLADIFDPTNRRYHYPFTSCTNCGPRYSIIQGLPYDRPQTTMAGFTMCPSCEQEYTNPSNRRFHAQPIACPQCGPKLQLWNRQGEIVAHEQEALLQAAEIVRQGQILALKGLGGFHLMVDARDPIAIQTLRQRKQRPDKPFAVMFPTLAAIAACCELDDRTSALLQSAAAPIVLLTQQKASIIASNIAPNNPLLGAMLPYTPLHALLMAELNFPIVATSGNVSKHPICWDESQVLGELGEIADMFLVHDRPIDQPMDDSVVRIVHNQPMLLRRARGYAPMTIPYPNPDDKVVLAVGGHLKNTMALLVNQQIVVSQYVGDLGTIAGNHRLQTTVEHLLNLYGVQPEIVACDLHPDYDSTQFAMNFCELTGAECIPIQHHYAHVLSGIWENQLAAPLLGVAWDGSGYGLDGTIWGGEFLLVEAQSFQRVAHLRQFPLPGGARAVQEPRRAALGLLYEYWGDRIWNWQDLYPLQAFTKAELAIIQPMLQQSINCPKTSSIGRLFDAVSALLGYCQRSSFEGQAAMQLEFAAAKASKPRAYSYDISLSPSRVWQLDFDSMLAAILEDLRQGVAKELIAVQFHQTLIESMVEICCRVGIRNVLLTGGCFQNQYLLEQSIAHLQRSGFTVHWHRQVPTNDGGLAVGQIVGALREQMIVPNAVRGEIVCV